MSRWLQAARQAGFQPFSTSANSVNTVNLPQCGENAGNAEFAEKADIGIDAFEERTALREIDGGKDRADAERAAAAEVGQPLEQLLSRPDEPSDASDAEVLLALLRARGPTSYGAAATLLGWGATRAWRAEAELRAAGRVRLGALGEAIPNCTIHGC